MSKHTPGPWGLDGNSIIAQFEEQEVQIAAMMHTRWTYPDDGKTERLHEQCKANAALMVRAPDLLAALKAITHAYVREMQRGAVKGYDPEKELIVKQAHSIIAELEERDGNIDRNAGSDT